MFKEFEDLFESVDELRVKRCDCNCIDEHHYYIYINKIDISYKERQRLEYMCMGWFAENYPSWIMHVEHNKTTAQHLRAIRGPKIEKLERQLEDAHLTILDQRAKIAEKNSEIFNQMGKIQEMKGVARHHIELIDELVEQNSNKDRVISALERAKIAAERRYMTNLQNWLRKAATAETVDGFRGCIVCARDGAANTILPCTHTYCGECVGQLDTCPECRTEYTERETAMLRPPTHI